MGSSQKMRQGEGGEGDEGAGGGAPVILRPLLPSFSAKAGNPEI